jgi:DNA-cytosine methyltransferase
MIVLSLFDGMGCGYEALKRAGIYVTKYYASEINKYAMQTAKKNHPDIIHLGDVQNWQQWNIDKPDLIIGGSPCQGFSFAGEQLAFDDPRSKLFFEMTDIIDYFKPEFKLLENVKMKKEFLEIITDFMNCGEPHFINSALVSAQNRQRFYWYNWDAPDPLDRGILLRDIIEPTGQLLFEKEIAYMNREVNGGRNHWDFAHHSDSTNPKSAAVVANFSKGVPYNVLVQQYPRGKNKGFSKAMEKSPTLTSNDFEQNVRIGEPIRIGTATDIKGHDYNKRIYSTEGKSPTLNAASGGNLEPKVSSDGVQYRKLTPVECERLQTLRDGYTEGVSNSQRYKMIGNGWTVEVIAHLLRYMPINDFQRMMG